MKKALGSLCTLALSLIAMSANADIIRVTATGTIYDSYQQDGYTYVYDGLVGDMVTATWTFDTDDVPSLGSCGSSGSTWAYYCDGSDWINGTVSIDGSGSGTVNENDSGDNDYSDSDWLYIQDNNSTYEYYQIGTYSYDGYPDYDYFYSYAYFYAYYQDILDGLSANQTFSWADSDSSNDYGYGYFQYYGYDGSTTTANYSRTSGSYYVNTMTAVRVSEPGTLALLGLGLFAMGAAVRRRRAG